MKPTRGRGIAAEHDTRIDHIDAALDDFELRQMQVAVEHPAIGCVENASRRDFAAIAVDEGIVKPAVDAGDLGPVDVTWLRVCWPGDIVALDVPDERHGLVEQIGDDGNARLAWDLRLHCDGIEHVEMHGVFADMIVAARSSSAIRVASSEEYSSSTGTPSSPDHC